MAGFGKIKGAISLPTTTALNSAVYGIYTLAEAEAYRKLGRWPTAPTFPGAPTSLTATAGNSRASLSWSAPSDNGGASVTDYSVQYSSDNGSTWSTFSHSASASTSAVVTSLTNDTAYVFRVAAVNSVGAGNYTAASSQITPQAPPADDPYYQRVELLLHFDPADMNGGPYPVDSSNAARTVYMNNGSIVTDSGSLSPIATTGGVYSLSGGGSPFPLMAYGAGLNAGTGDYTLEWWWKFTGNQGWITHRTNGHTPGDYWLRVVNNGNTDKFLTCQYFNPSPYNIDNVWAVSVTALVNQWAHIAVSRVAGFTRVFINGQQATLGTATNGDSPFSTTAVFTADPAVMDFQSDNYGGNDHIAMVLFGFSYEITSGYIDDLRYTVGLGRYMSNFSPPTGPFSNTGPAMAPGQPRSLTATAGEQQVSLSWTAPLRNGGASITDYIVQYSSDSGSTWTTFSDGTSTSTSATVTGLTNSTTYKFRVAAVNNVGAGAYAVSGNAIPSVAITITAQPKNDYATASNQNVTFTVAATGGGGSLVYQWQYYGPNYSIDDYDYKWRDFSGATSSSYAVNGNMLSDWAVLAYDFYYTGQGKIRCAVSPSGGGTPVYTDVVRFIELDYQHSLSINWYGSYGSYTNWGTYQTLSTQEGENVILDVYDYAMGYPDTSWYTGNDLTLKIQIATTGHTDSADWSDLYSTDARGGVYLSGYQLSTGSGTKYYRAILLTKWPYNVNNGTQSATHATQYMFPSYAYNVLRVTWPAPAFTPTAVMLTSGTSYTVPAGATNMKAWLVTQGGSGGFGRGAVVAWKTFSVTGGQAISYVVQPARSSPVRRYSIGDGFGDLCCPSTTLTSAKNTNFGTRYTKTFYPNQGKYGTWRSYLSFTGTELPNLTKLTCGDVTIEAAHDFTSLKLLDTSTGDVPGSATYDDFYNYYNADGYPAFGGWSANCDGGQFGGEGNAYGWNLNTVRGNLPYNSGAGGAVGGNASNIGAPTYRNIMTDVSGLKAALTLAGVSTTQGTGASDAAAFGSGGSALNEKFGPTYTPGIGGGGSSNGWVGNNMGGSGAIVLYFT
jgi:hypothetical protein